MRELTDQLAFWFLLAVLITGVVVLLVCKAISIYLHTQMAVDRHRLQMAMAEKMMNPAVFTDPTEQVDSHPYL